MPIQRTVEDDPPKTPHLGLLTNLKPPWVAIHPGNWMAYSPGGKDKATPMVLVSVKPSNYGLEMEFACCTNTKCTRRMKFAAKWTGRHFAVGTDEEVKGE